MEIVSEIYIVSILFLKSIIAKKNLFKMYMDDSVDSDTNFWT